MSKGIWIADNVLGGMKLRISIIIQFLTFISILVPGPNLKKKADFNIYINFLSFLWMIHIIGRSYKSDYFQDLLKQED